jgi:hypothetical protein
MFDRFYRFGSKSKVKFYFYLIYGILGLHLTVYAVGLARHEFAIFLLNSQITNITTLSEGKNPNLALQGIPRLQKKLPVEPKIYNIITSIKSLFPCFDDYNRGAYQELSYLLAHHKDSLKNLNLNGFTFLGSSDDPESGNFKYSDFQNVKLVKARLSNSNFSYSKFYEVDFFVAEMENADFAFVTFDKCKLDAVNLQGSNLCGAQFINSGLDGSSNLDQVNLVGVDLSKAFNFEEIDIRGRIHLTSPSLQGAYYNSKAINIFNDAQYVFLSLNFPSCVKDHREFPPTKFPEGFDPEAHEMIDISKL